MYSFLVHSSHPKKFNTGEHKIAGRSAYESYNELLHFNEESDNRINVLYPVNPFDLKVYKELYLT